MFIANAWVSFMTSPGGVSESGALVSVWDAVCQLHVDADQHPPPDRQRRVRRVGGGGLRRVEVPAARSNEEERAHYDWMGYIGNIIAIAGLPTPAVRGLLARRSTTASTRRWAS